MARIRTVKPEFWTDEKLGRLKREERLLFIGLWNIADDQGVVKSNAAYIKGQLFSYDDDLRGDTVNVWLASLVKARMLVPFTIGGEGYFIIRTFGEHQLINRPSKLKFSEEFLLKVKNTHGVFSEYSQPEGNGMEGKGKEQESDFEKKFSNQKENNTGLPPPEIVMPFAEKFKAIWDQWKIYKDKEFKFKYKSEQSEQASINELMTLSDGLERNAIEIITQSMAKGWKGFFKINNNESVSKNGKTRTGEVTDQQVNQAFAKFYQREKPG